MNKSKKILLMALVSAVTLSAGTTAYARGNNSVIVQGMPVIIRSCPKEVEDAKPQEAVKHYASFTGVIKEFRNFFDANGISSETKRYILVEDDKGEQMEFFAGEYCYFGSGSLALEDEITAYYDTTAPMPMIYPPQPTAVAIVPADTSPKSVEVDFFDENLVNSDNTLKLNVSESTEIVNIIGEKFTGSLENRALAVCYTITTRSIPAQTPPDRIVVLGSPFATEDDSVNISDLADERFVGFTGTVTEVEAFYDTDGKPVEGSYFVLVTNAEGELVNFRVTNETLRLDGTAPITKGATLTGYYDSNLPVIMIYPPQYGAVAVRVVAK